jgi:D-serine deaminase-like pyridoxal phosphate-dependent protein
VIGTEKLPLTVDEVDTPAVLVDRKKLVANLRQVDEIAKSHNADLRPHAKTHKSRALTRLQLERGAVGITVAKLDEAGALSDSCRDIFLAYPITSDLKALRAMDYAADFDLTVAVDTVEGAEALSRAAKKKGLISQVLIEVDCGLRRCGIDPEDTEDFTRRLIALGAIEVVGVFSHAGHAYGALSSDELREIARCEIESVTVAADKARKAGADIRVLSVGSTPTILANLDELDNVTELRPGNYVFKDRTQVELGVATLEECALTVLTTVVSTVGGNAVIDSGSKTLGLDRGAHGNNATDGYGLIESRGMIVDRLSEEHGVISGGAPRLRAGERLRIVPNHACVVTNLTDAMYLVDGDEVVSRLEVDVRGGGR